MQYFQLADDPALIGEEGHALLNGEFKHFGDVAPTPSHLQCLLTVAATLARRTCHFHVRHEGQLGNDGTVTGACFATSAIDVKTESGWTEAPCLGLVRLGKELANRIVDPDVGRRIGARGSADGGLINIDDRSEEHTSELQSHSDLVCRLLLEKK